MSWEMGGTSWPRILWSKKLLTIYMIIFVFQGETFKFLFSLSCCSSGICINSVKLHFA